jgi:hypothetical protein
MPITPAPLHSSHARGADWDDAQVGYRGERRGARAKEDTINSKEGESLGGMRTRRWWF